MLSKLTNHVIFILLLVLLGLVITLLKSLFLKLGMIWKNRQREEPDVVRWINATHAILTVMNGKDPLIYGGVENSDGWRENEQKLLVDWWGITDRQSLLEMIVWLIDEGGHRVDYVVNPQKIAAWDYSRALQLLSSGYLAGYLTRKEALNRSLPIAKRCQQEFGSWDAFVHSYILGFKYWSKSDGSERREVYEEIRRSEQNIYDLPWNLKLVKKW